MLQRISALNLRDQYLKTSPMTKNYQPQVAEALAEIDFDANDYQIQLNTNHGQILLKLLPDVAPGHCGNMIALAKIGFYDNLTFHRIIPGFMIQGGCPAGTGTGGPGYNINQEFNDTPHKEGVLSMARSQDPNSGGSQFFICLGSHPHLDGQYTAFGHTANPESMAVVKKLGELETDHFDKPTSPAIIESAVVVTTPRGA
jgi:cyclophilin family peptidyl-prolyl cis-trans isomerase